MEYVAFEYALDFVLKKPTSTNIFFIIIAKLFAALSVVTITKRFWSASRYDLTSG